MLEKNTKEELLNLKEILLKATSMIDELTELDGGNIKMIGEYLLAVNLLKAKEQINVIAEIFLKKHLKDAKVELDKGASYVN